MEYYFNEISPVSFQRLINAVLVARFGEHIRLMPLRGSDGGRDAEIAPDNPCFEAQINTDTPAQLSFAPIRRGRYLFQVKHHRTIDSRISDVRKSVLNDFDEELNNNVISRFGDEKVDYFFLITNVPSRFCPISGNQVAET